MSRQLPYPNPLRLASAFLVLCLFITAFVTYQSQTNNHEYVQRKLRQLGTRLSDEIIERIDLYQYGLRSTRGVVITAGQNLSRDLFRQYSASRDIDTEFPGAHGFGFIRRVRKSEQAAFVERARRDGYPDFHIHQLSPHHGDRFVIQYIEPIERNRQAVGLDIASERNRRDAAVDAIRSGEVRLTGPITLVQATGHPLESYLILMPIYKGVVTPPTIAQRKKLGYGWSYAPLVMQEVLAGLELDRNLIHLDLRDVTSAGVGSLVFNSDPRATDLESLPRYTAMHRIYGRIWRFDYSAYPAFAESLDLLQPPTVAITGVLISALMFVALWMYFDNLRSRRQSAYHRNLLASVVESSADAIITSDLEGRVTSWNSAAERLFGFSPQEAVGASLSSLIVPPELQNEEKQILEKIADNREVLPYTTKRKQKNGAELDVSIAVAPVGGGTSVAGYAKIIRDITEEVEAKRQIVEINRILEALVEKRTREVADSRGTLKGILDNIPSHVGYWDGEMRLVMANRGTLERCGVTLDEAVGRHYRDLVHKDGLDKTWPTFEKAMASGEPQSTELKVDVADGDYQSIQFLVVPEIKDGKISGFYSMSHDVTELRKNREQLEIAIRENEALLSTINQQMLYSVTDVTGNIIDMNENFCRVSGYERAELLGKDHRLMNSGVHPQHFWHDMWRAVGAGHSWHGEICNRCKDGSLRWFDSVIAPFVGADGNIERYVALRTDITENYEAEKERNRVNWLLSNVLDAASEVSIIATDCDGIITIFNTGAENMLGYAADEMVGKRSPAIIHDELEVVERGLELSAQFGEEISGFEVFVYMARLKKSETRKWTYVRKDGRRLRVSLAVTAMREDDNHIVGYLGVATDITEQEYRSRESQRARESADNANKAKSVFLANMSHEIRTPMNAVLGMLRLVSNTPLDPRQLDYIAKAEIAAKSLLELLNDLLDFSKIDAGKLTLEKGVIDLEQLMRELAAVLSGYQNDQRIQLVFAIDPTLPRQVCGDPLRLQQVLVNLGGNALKFTESGLVVVHIDQVDSNSDRVNMRFAVTDTGIGISDEQKERIFEDFTQAEASISRRFGGTGLGLVICQRLVHMMGGKLHVESQLGKGSRFWFEVTLGVADSRALAVANPRASILLVEECQPVADILADMLAAVGYRVDTVRSAAAAIGQLTTADKQNKHYDVVLMDWGLSDLRGGRASEFIADIPLQPRPHIILLVAAGQEFEWDDSDEADRHYDGLVNKPVTPAQLQEAIARVMDSEPASGDDRVAVVPPRGLEGLRLLVVEDNDLNRQVAAELLATEGADVALAAGGLEGVEKVLGGAGRFDLVIMDMQMPDIDGLEATRRIRADGGFNDLPILAMTANASPSDREMCIAAGMNEHIGKPIDIERVVPIIRQLVDDRALADRGASEKPASNTLRDEVMKRFGGSVSMFGRVLPKYAPSMLQLVKSLVRSVENRELSGALMAIHSIKGTSATMGSMALSDFAAELERQIKEYGGGDWSSMLSPEVLRQLRVMVDASIEELNTLFADMTSEKAVRASPE